MERFEKITEILSDPKQDQLNFLNQLLDHIFIQTEIPEAQESTYKKAILYITCWILLPQTSIPSLPSEFSSIISLLNTNASSLLPKFFENFQASYENLPEIICNDTLLTICLTISEYNEKIFSFLRAEHCISPLMWLLTYSPSHLKLASEMLPRAICKKGGVKELLECFARGDDSWKLKNLCIKILKKTPRTGKKEYVELVVEQVVEIMTQYNCDKIVESAMEDVSNYYLQNFPDSVLPYIKKFSSGCLNASQIVKFFRIFAQYLPPNYLILFGISDFFGFFVELWMHVHGTVLQIRNEILTIFVQFFVYWEYAGENFVQFLEGGLRQYVFLENSNSEIEFIKAQPETIENFSSLFSLFTHFSEVSGASLIFPKIFSSLLENFTKGQNSNLLSCLSYILETIEPIFLVNMPKNIENLLKNCIMSENEELTLIILQILLYTPQDQLTKDFWLQVSPKVINAKNSENPEIADLGSQINEKISKVFQNSTTQPDPIVQKPDESWSEELDSKEAYLNAIGLHKLSLTAKENTDIPWKKLQIMLEKEDFVFGELLKCYIKLLEIQGDAGISELIQSYHNGVDGVKLRVLEILFFWAKNSKNALKFSDRVLTFLNQISSQSANDEIIDGSLVVTAQLVRRLKSSFFPYIGNYLHNILNTLSLCNSRLTTKQDLPKHISSSLVLLRKLLKHCPATEDYLNDLTTVIKTFKSLYSNSNTNLSILLHNVILELETKILESLD